MNKHVVFAFLVLFIAMLGFAYTSYQANQTMMQLAEVAIEKEETIKQLEKKLQTHEPLNTAQKSGLAIGSPTAVEVAYSGFSRGHTGHFTEWVYEHLTYEHLNAEKVSRSNAFHADPNVPKEFRVVPADYTGTGYDKGHNAPDDDCNFSVESDHESFLMSNMMPQTKRLNEVKWLALEKEVRSFVTTTVDAHVYTGPAFLPNASGTITITTIGKHGQWVPNSCWKVVLLVVNETKPVKMYAWMMPNSEDPPDYTDCEVAVDFVESMVGLDFFSGLPDDIEKELESKGL